MHTKKSRLQWRRRLFTQVHVVLVVLVVLFDVLVMTKAFYLPSNFQKIFERCFVKCNLCKMFRYSAEKADRISHNQSNVLRRIATQWIKTVQKSLILNHKEIVVISRIFQKRFVAFSRIFQFKMVQKNETFLGKFCTLLYVLRSMWGNKVGNFGISLAF